MTLLALLLIVGALSGTAIAALGHPGIYRLVFRRRACRTLDHKVEHGGLIE